MKRVVAFIFAFFAVCYLQLATADAQFRPAECRYGFCGHSGASGKPISNACSTSSGTTITFTAQGVGGANPKRVTVVSINWDDSTAAGTAQITNVTVGGLSMARAVRSTNGVGNSNSEIWWVPNPTGTTANIVITAATAINATTIEVYSLIGYNTFPVTSATGTTSASQAYSNKQLALAAGSRTVNVSTSLSNMTNDFSSACGANLWGVHASQPLHGNGTLTTAISPTSNNPQIALAVWSQQVIPPPPGVTGLLAWYDVSVTTSLSLSGANVAGISDISGNGNNLGGGGVLPTYSATGFNSLPGITVANSGTSLSRDNVAFGTGNTLTVAWVGQFNAGSASYGRMVSYTANGGGNTDANNNQSWLLSRESTTTDAVLYRNAVIAHAVAGAYSTPHTIIGTIDSSGVQTIYIDGVATTGSTLNAAFGSPGQLVLSNLLSGTNSALNGSFGEVIIATAFTNSTNVAALQAYLKPKWNTP